MSRSDAVSRLNAALEGRYTIERELGEGGMTLVHPGPGPDTASAPGGAIMRILVLIVAASLTSTPGSSQEPTLAWLVADPQPNTVIRVPRGGGIQLSAYLADFDAAPVEGAELMWTVRDSSRVRYDQARAMVIGGELGTTEIEARSVNEGRRDSRETSAASWADGLV